METLEDRMQNTGDGYTAWANQLPILRVCILFSVICLLWSAQPAAALIVSEVMYHPVDADEKLEFVELYNEQAVFEDLGGYKFTNGIEYTFAPGTTLASKQYLVVARDPAALQAAYDISGVRGPFTGRLNNDGERIDLSNAGGEIVISLRYGDSRPWPASPDGTGHSLVLARFGSDPQEASSWSPSTFIGGTPGRPDQI